MPIVSPEERRLEKRAHLDAALAGISGATQIVVWACGEQVVVVVRAEELHVISQELTVKSDIDLAALWAEDHRLSSVYFHAAAVTRDRGEPESAWYRRELSHALDVARSLFGDSVTVHRERSEVRMGYEVLTAVYARVGVVALPLRVPSDEGWLDEM